MGRVKTGSSELAAGSDWSDIDVEVTECVAKKVHVFIKKDGSKGKPSKTPGVYIAYKTDDGRELSDFHALSQGVMPAASIEDAEAGVVADEGDFLTSEGGKGLSDNFGWGIYVKALEAAGYDTSQLDENGFSTLVGERLHIVNVDTGRKDKEGNPYRIRVPNQYHKAGASAGSPASASAGKPGKTAAASAGNGKVDTLEADLEAVAVAVLEEAGKPMFKAMLLRGVNAVIEGDPEWPAERARKAANLILSDTYLKGEGRPWKYDGKRIQA